MFRRSGLRILTLTAALAHATVPALADCNKDAMLVFDGSASMVEFVYEPGRGTRIAEARLATAEAIPAIAPLRRIGLLVYGPGGADGCSGIALRFPPRQDAAAPIIAAIDALRPGGLTPLSSSVLRAAEVLDHRTRPGIIVVVTDGNETCGGRPCETGQILSATSEDLTVHVIGFRVNVDYWAWNNPEQKALGHDDTVARCLADLNKGQYIRADTIEDLVKALTDTLGCALFSDLRTRPLRPRLPG